MQRRVSIGIVLTALCVLLLGALPVRSGIQQNGRKAAERGLAFLQKDVAKFRATKKCASCHEGTITVWALTEAQSQGYAIAPESLAEIAKWTRDGQLSGIDLPRETPAGKRGLNTTALYLGMLDLAVPGQQAVPSDDLKRIASHLVRYQEADGAWSWSAAPAQNRPPPVMESDEVATLIGYLALEPRLSADSSEASAIRASRDRAAAWLEKSAAGDSNQAAALRLLLAARSGKSGKEFRHELDAFVKRQNSDGGWSPTKDLPSDAYSTGQALYFLRLSGVKKDRTAIQRGVAFLVGQQRSDGSWLMTPRAHPGAKPMKDPGPISYFGSAWATMGLMRASSE